MAPFAGNPQKIHMVSIKLRKNGTVIIWSTVLWRLSNVRGKSAKTSGCVATNGRDPAVVARKPGSCLKFSSETAVVDPPRVFRRFRRAFHSFSSDYFVSFKIFVDFFETRLVFLTSTAFGPSSACSIRRSSKALLDPIGNRQ